MAVEGFVLDGLDLNPAAGTFKTMALSMPPPKKRPEWAEYTDGDGALLVRDPLFENRTIEATVEVWAATRDAGHTAVGQIVDKLEEAERHALGIPLVWTPADSTKSLTFYVLSGEVTEYPIDVQSGYFASTPVLRAVLSLTCRPFGYGIEISDLADDFSVDTIGSGLWAFDSGTGTIAVSGGQLVPSTTGDKEMFRTDREFYDAEVTVKVTTGTTNPGAASVTGKRIDGSNYLLLGHLLISGALEIYKKDGGSFTQLATTAVTVNTSTNYWLRGRIEGNKITAELFTSAPGPASTPSATVTHTLSGADATKFGQGIGGEAGLRFSTMPTDSRADDFSASPNVYKGSGPLLIGTISGVAGDVPAEARLVVTDTATQSRDFAAWGLEWRHQNGSDLLLTQNELTATGFAGTSTTRSGSVSTNVFRGTLTTVPVAVCGTGNQPHIGVYRVFCRYWASGTGVRLRLTYKDGDGPLTPLLYATPPEDDSWFESDLGVVTIVPKLLGTQRWRAQIEAYSDVGGDTIDIDYLALVPAGEGFGRARWPSHYETATSFSARDEFDQSAGALTGKTAPVGGVWVGAGDADDFSVETTGATAQRTAVSDVSGTGRYAISGVAGFAAQVSQVDFKFDPSPGAITILRQGVLARYIDTSNWLRIQKTHASGGTSANVIAIKNVATNQTGLDTASFEFSSAAWYTMRVMVDAAGRWYVWVFPRGGHPSAPLIGGQDADLATGGALASGKPGFYDEYPNAPACTRNYDNFVAFAPEVDTSIFSGQSIEFRHDETQREDSTGTYWGSPREYRGAPFFIPAAGDENRTSRVAVMARRHDIETMPSSGPTDTYSVQAHYTPRYLVVPR